ncbi:MAG TPA: hypothetical protein VK119_01015 [Bacillota bacterium]|nr:hypothetical protein [Bacillota bacterium]
MNIDKFTSLTAKQRVNIVNNLLKREGFRLQEVAKEIGMKYSSFTKLMQEDDYVYIKRDNQYYKFIRDEKKMLNNVETDNDEIAYIKENFSTLKELIELRKDNSDLLLDKRIYHSSSKHVTKNFRISDEIYKQFTRICNEQYPHLKIQDIVSQLLLDFIDKHTQPN